MRRSAPAADRAWRTLSPLRVILHYRTRTFLPDRPTIGESKGIRATLNAQGRPSFFARARARVDALRDVVGFVATACALLVRANAAEVPPAPQREFRGVWIATVANMDWPSKPGLPAAQQKTELIALLNRARELNFNAVILQVRPACDAFYSSRLEPWSEYLTGTMGQPPEPHYDPLAFAIEEAHARGLELHAWFNPFRARVNSAKSPAAPKHISRARPSLVRKYGHYLWLDPAVPEVRQHSTSVILDVVRRYNIDGVHLDDYFYPYPAKDGSGKAIEFPDDAAWKRYRANGGTLSRADWRRQHVDDFIRNLYQRIKAEKSWVRFGISPFGIWRPGHPPSVTGLDAYDTLYADARKWLANGWVDYLAPQLYWSDAAQGQSFSVLLKWWIDQNAAGRHLWPGMKGTEVGKSWRADEIANQIAITRRTAGATGQILWNISSLADARNGLAAAVSRSYAEPALVPASPWLDRKPPPKPRVTHWLRATQQIDLAWSSSGEERPWLWLVQSKTGNRWTTAVLPVRQTSHSFSLGAAGTELQSVSVSAVDRCGNTSPPTVLDIASILRDSAKK